MESHTEEKEYIINKAYRGISCLPCSSANHEQLDRHRLIFFSGFFVFHISTEAGRWTPKIRLGSDFQLVRCHMSHPDVSVDLTVTKQLSFGSINLFMSTFSPYCLRIRYQHLTKSNVCTIYIFSLCDVMCTVAFLTFFLFTSFCRAWFHQELILQHEFNWAFQ